MAQCLARLHARIANVRRDALQKLTTMLVREHGRICIEDLGVRGMMANRHLLPPSPIWAFTSSRRQLGYKAKRAGTEIIVAERFFASAKTCSCCGRGVHG